ncbi:MAG: DUF4399 domain-containing protein [Deltaproteobacteria bacterium]|nr:DUF4399 domain-containing protein [Deltaproteobacteria bacterium]
MNRPGIWQLFAAVLLGFLAFAGNAAAQEQRAFFIEPKDGAEVRSPVKVVMGVEGMTIKASGGVVAGTGHHHILINQGPMRGGKIIPTDKTHVHFGKGQTEASLELAPGDYTLTMQFADGLHRSFGKKMAHTIKIKVLPAK